MAVRSASRLLVVLLLFIPIVCSNERSENGKYQQIPIFPQVRGEVLAELSPEPSMDPDDKIPTGKALFTYVKNQVVGTYQHISLKTYFDVPQDDVMKCPHNISLGMINITMDGNISLPIISLAVNGHDCLLPEGSVWSDQYIRLNLLESPKFKHLFTGGSKSSSSPMDSNSARIPSAGSCKTTRTSKEGLELVSRAKNTEPLRNSESMEMKRPHLRWGGIFPPSVKCNDNEMPTGYAIIVDAERAFPMIFRRIIWAFRKNGTAGDSMTESRKSENTGDSSSESTRDFDSNPLWKLENAFQNSKSIFSIGYNTRSAIQALFSWWDPYRVQIEEQWELITGIKVTRPSLLHAGRDIAMGSEDEKDMNSDFDKEPSKLWGKFLLSYYMAHTAEACYYVKQSDNQTVMHMLQEYKLMRENNRGPMSVKLEAVCGCQDGYPMSVEIIPSKLRPANLSGGLMDLAMPDWYGEGNDTYSHGNNQNKSYYIQPDAFKVNNVSCEAEYFGSIGHILHPVFKNKTLDKIQQFIANMTTQKLIGETFGDQAMKKTLYENAQRLHDTISVRKYATKVLFLKNGTNCGGVIVKNDTVVLVENVHMLYQLAKARVTAKIPKEKRLEIANFDTERMRYTIHAFANMGNGNVSACSYSSSSKLVEEIDKHCEDYHPLGTIQIGKGMMKNKTKIGDNGDQPSHGTGPGSSNEDRPRPGDDNRPEPSDGTLPVSNISHGRPGHHNPYATPELANIEASYSPSNSVTPQTPTPTATRTPATSPSATPSTPATTETTGTSNACFPGAAKVETDERGMISMAKVRLGDRIRDASGAFSRVILMAHNRSDVATEFIHITAEGADIMLSPLHYLFVGGRLRKARSVSAGDEIELAKDTEYCGEPRLLKVVNVSKAFKKGLFAPVTVSGTLAVRWSGLAVSASCYTADSPPWLAHAILWPLRMLDQYARITVPMFSRSMLDGSRFWANTFPEGNSWSRL